jgi:hypothetical protein
VTVSSSFLFASLAKLPTLALNEPFICWLHIVGRPWPGFDEAIMAIARCGAGGFYVTGPDSADIHDRLDDILEVIQRPDIPTIWGDDIDYQMAWDFLNLDLSRPLPRLRVVGVDAPDAEQELKAMLAIIIALQQAQD